MVQPRRATGNQTPPSNHGGRRRERAQAAYDGLNDIDHNTSPIVSDAFKDGNQADGGSRDRGKPERPTAVAGADELFRAHPSSAKTYGSDDCDANRRVVPNNARQCKIRSKTLLPLPQMIERRVFRCDLDEHGAICKVAVLNPAVANSVSSPTSCAEEDVGVITSTNFKRYGQSFHSGGKHRCESAEKGDIGVDTKLDERYSSSDGDSDNDKKHTSSETQEVVDIKPSRGDTGEILRKLEPLRYCEREILDDRFLRVRLQEG